MSSRHQKSARNAPQNYVISKPNPISVMLRMDIPLIRKTSVSIFYGEA